MDIKQETIEKLESMGFSENENKQGLWGKPIDGGFANWDFRKNKNGKFYTTIDGGGFESDELAKQRAEYLGLRASQGDKKIKTSVIHPIPIPIPQKDSMVLRGNENDVSRVVCSRRLDMIAKASRSMGKDGLGEGVLYHNLGSKIGFEPSADLIDMICCDMGGIETHVVESGFHRHINTDTGDEYQTVYAIVNATDTVKGTIGIGSAEEVVDYNELEKTGRSFAFTKVLRKSRRNAIERLIPIPRKALVELVKQILEENKKGK